MALMERFSAMTHVEVAHLALDPARVESAAAADATPSGDFFEQCVAPGRQALRGEQPQLAAVFA